MDSEERIGQESTPVEERVFSASAGGASRPPKKRRVVEPDRMSFGPQQRLLILDAWERSELKADEFAPLVGVSEHTLQVWRRRFERLGPVGLEDRPRGGAKGSRLPTATQRAILLMKRSHPEWGAERLHQMLWRSEGYAASAGAIQRVLREAGYEAADLASERRGEGVHRFERARPNQLWQTDLFTFTLKRENRRLHAVVFLDDHSRFVVGFGVHASASGAMVREVLEQAIADFGPPEEVLTDNGTQYRTWRGKSAFQKLLERRGIRHVVARPRHPQTLGKTERFWGTLWRECLETAVLRSVDEARERIGHFIGYYNFQRTHQGIEGLVPADRYFEAAPEVRKALEARVDANALSLARDGVPRKSVYLAGRVGDETIALHGEGDRVILTREDGRREEVELAATGRRASPEPPSSREEPPSPEGGAS